MAVGGEARLEAIREDMEGQLGHWEGTSPKQASREFGEQALETILQHFQPIVQRLLVG